MTQRIVFFLWLLSACFLPSCSTQKEARIPWQTIQGRDRTVTRPLYRVRAPLDWVRTDPTDQEGLSDTTLPIATFYIQEGAEPIRITIHNFPYTDNKQRIPPEAQVARWKRQQKNTSATSTITPVSHGGFHGLFFEGDQVLAWSMKIGDPYEQLFQSRLTQTPFTRALRADYTIKAVGQKDLLEIHRDALIAFARSFEWIEEMPRP